MSEFFRRLLCPVALTLSVTVSAVIASAATEPTAVTEAYVGPLTQAKHDAALSGLQALTTRLSLLPGGDYGCGNDNASISTNITLDSNFFPAFSGSIVTEIEAGSDQDLGQPGAAVTLDGAALKALATFVTARDLIIGANAGQIDTNGYSLTITGNLEAAGDFKKVGDGILSLAGSSQWHGHQVFVYGGVLRGDTNSLQTSIHNSNAVLEFHQTEDGVYGSVLSGAGAFHKTGSGILTLSGANAVDINGDGLVFIDEGGLSLAESGKLGAMPAVTIAPGAFLDLSATSDDQVIGPLAGEGAVFLGQRLIVNEGTEDTVYAGVISGAGMLTKTADGTLALTGTNTYRGGTIIEHGRLALAGAGRLNPNATLSIQETGEFDISAADGEREVGALSGEAASTITLGANSLTIGSAQQDTSFSGLITGSGGIVKTGTGTLTLDGSNYYSGVTSVRQGTLAVSAAMQSSRIENDATLIFYENAAPTTITAYDGAITGSGQLAKEGNGILWLRGANAYSGGTTVNSGVLIGNTDSLNGEITNHHLLAFYQVSPGTHDGGIGGEGTLLAYGPGILTLDGANTYTGGTAVSGTLRVAEDANLGAADSGLLLVGGRLLISRDFNTHRPLALSDLDGALSTFDTNGYNLILAGPITGPGSLRKEGDGTLTLAGANTFAGNSEVRNGRLAVDGALNGDLVIDAGAEAGGAGFIGGDLTNHGQLARGASIGPITVGGNVILSQESSLTIKADPAGNADCLVLTGVQSSVTLQGASLDVQAVGGNYRFATDYTILFAPAGITGEFATVVSNLAFLTPTLDYGPQSVELSLTRNDISYESVAASEDQRAVARILSHPREGDFDLGAVVEQLNSLSGAEACQAFDSIAGRERAIQPQVTLLNQRALAQVAVSRLGGVATNDLRQTDPEVKMAGGYLQLAANDLIASDAPLLYALAGQPIGAGNESPPDSRNGLWLQGFGGTGEIKANASGHDSSYTLGGIALGYDHTLGHAATIGLLGAYSNPRLRQEANRTTTNSTQAGAYGRYLHGDLGADLVVTFSKDNTESSRHITVGGLTRHALADYDGHGTSITSEFGYTIATVPVSMQPFIGVQWSRQRHEAYSETGAGGLNLSIPATAIESLRSRLGLGASRFFGKEGKGLSVEGRAGWAHEFQGQGTIGATLNGDPAASIFSLAEVDIPRDSGQLGVGLAYSSQTLHLYVNLDSDFNKVRQEHTLTAGLGYRW